MIGVVEVKKKYIIIIVIVTLINILISLNGILFKEKSNIVEENINTINKDDRMISMMLETEAGSGNYEMTTRSEWPTEGYKFNSELSKCENGGELSWDDTNKKVLMSGNTSDRCYVYFDFQKNITFILEDTQYQAEEGMTFETWINSKYNTYGYQFSNVTTSNTGDFTWDVKDKIIDDKGSYIMTDFIHNSIEKFIDADGNYVDQKLLSLSYYSEKVNTLNSEFSSHLYDREYVIKQIMLPVTGNDVSSYNVGLPFTFVNNSNNTTASSIKYPLEISFGIVTTDCKIIQYHQDEGMWSEIEVITNNNIVTSLITRYNYNDPFIIVCK